MPYPIIQTQGILNSLIYQLAPSVVSDDLVLTVNNNLGVTPTGLAPVIFDINGFTRTLDGARTITLADGTNYFASGSVMLGGQSVDYFVYAVWNTTPATDRVDIIISRIPFAKTYSNFSATNTVWNHGAYSGADQPQASDQVILIGRFSATLSVSPGFDWSAVANIISYPIVDTRELVMAPDILVASGGTSPTYTDFFRTSYQITNNKCKLTITWVNASGGTAGAGAGQLSGGLPVPLSASSFGGAALPYLGSGYMYEAGGLADFIEFLVVSGGARFSIRKNDGALGGGAGDDQSGVSRGISGSLEWFIS